MKVEVMRPVKAGIIRSLRRMCCVAAFAAATVITPHADASIVIDDFTSVEHTWPMYLSNVASEQVSEVALASVIGSNRVTTVTADSMALPGVDFLRANIVASAGIFDYNSTAGASGSFVLSYQGAGGVGLGAYFGDQLGIAIHFADFDHAQGAPLPVTITLWDGLNTASLTLSLTSPGAQSHLFNFADFDNIGALGLAYVNGIEIAFDPAAGADFRIDSIASFVPAPGAVVVFGLAGLARSRKRR